MGAWYNEIDRFKAATLRNLIEEGAIAHGVVDERPIQAVQPEDLAARARQPLVQHPKPAPLLGEREAA